MVCGKKRRKISREQVAGIFYNDAKLSRFYNGRVPQSLQMSQVRRRLYRYTAEGKRRKK